jgi:hypothetical protein
VVAIGDLKTGACSNAVGGMGGMFVAAGLPRHFGIAAIDVMAT